MDFDQICVKMILAMSCLKLNEKRPSRWRPLLKIAKYNTGKIFQWNCTSFLLQ